MKFLKKNKKIITGAEMEIIKEALWFTLENFNDYGQVSFSENDLESLWKKVEELQPTYYTLTEKGKQYLEELKKEGQ